MIFEPGPPLKSSQSNTPHSGSIWGVGGSGRRGPVGQFFWLLSRLGLFFGLSAVLGVGAVFALYHYFSQGLPELIKPEDYKPLGVTRILAQHADQTIEIGEFYKERRYLIPFEKIPSHLIQAFLAAEDDRFFEHSGINLFSIMRAGIANFRAGHVVQGGSTITQQVAKSLLPTHERRERSLDRKLKEVILSTRLEHHLSKNQILYLYLNQIYLGHGAYGVQAASRAYFNKDVSALTIAEAALLAGMPQAPGIYSPLMNSKKAKERQLYVLKRMLENSFITAQQMAEAVRQPLTIYLEEDLNKKYSPYLVEFVRKYLVEKFGEKAVYENALTVKVPVQPSHLLAAAKSLSDGLRAVDKRLGYRGVAQHLSTLEEIEKFLVQQKNKFISQRLRFHSLMADGHFDQAESLRAAGFLQDADCLEETDYWAVVTGFDAVKKTAHLKLGTFAAELALSDMLWAKPARSEDDKQPIVYIPPPRSPARVFKLGDVILVRPLHLADFKKRMTFKAESGGGLGFPGAAAENSTPTLSVALEQRPQVQGALISFDLETGNLVAMAGGYDFSSSEFNRAIQAMRQPGSAFKPFIYAAALEKGFTPASIIVDSPLVFKDSGGAVSWRPNNYESKFYGDTVFRQALIKSRNIPTIKIVQEIQVNYLLHYIKRLGIAGQFPSDLSIALGSGSIALFDLVKAYALFPRLGRKLSPVFIQQIQSQEGQTLEEVSPQKSAATTPSPDPNLPPSLPDLADSKIPGEEEPTTASNDAKVRRAEGQKAVFPKLPQPSDPDQVLDPRVAYVMTHLMKEVVDFGTGHEAKTLGRISAGKTGTTNDSVDALYVGFTKAVITGVWVGYDTQKTLGPGETGAKAALPIWVNFMKEVVPSYAESDFNVPPGVVFASIDANTGKAVKPGPSNAIQEAFIEGTEPTSSSKTSDQGGSQATFDFYNEDRE